MPPPVFGAAFSFVLQAIPPRPAFRSRPGEGGIYRAGLIALRRADAEGVQLEREELVHPVVGEAVP